MPENYSAAGCHWRVTAYKELVLQVNNIFSSFLSDYCCNCQQVISRLPEAQEESFELIEGIYPGCCHRGAGDIFRLEGEPTARSHLASAIIDALQRERRQRVQEFNVGACGGIYQLRRQRDDTLTKGAHCQYFTDKGCSLGVLKGPLCIDFICPPMRSDLLQVCAGETQCLVGPEQDFLFIYRSLAVISYDCQEKVMLEMANLKRRVAAFRDCCRQFLIEKNASSLYEYFNLNGD